MSDDHCISDDFIIHSGRTLDADLVSIDDSIIMVMLLGGRHV
ncbi:hypothetical protein ACKI1J_34945 [Streptomyces scabiei]